MHGTEAVSPWIARWAHLAPAGGSVLDVACGHGRLKRPARVVQRIAAVRPGKSPALASLESPIPGELK